MTGFNYTLSAALHNHALVEKAQDLINNFIGDDDGIVYVQNPDGTCFKLQKGVKLISVSGFSIQREEDD